MPHKIPQTNATVYSVKPQAPLSETTTDSFVPYSPSASPRGPSYCQEYQKIDSKFIYDALRAGLESIFDCLYKWLQSFIVISFAPFKPKLDHTFNPPTKYTSTFTKNESSSDKSYVDDKIKSKSRIAIIGAGITGISTAAHFLTHGFEVMIFEQSSQVGGIWSRVNSTSALQLHSIVYRFHPSVKWSRRQEVKQGEILEKTKKIWLDYQLDKRTHFNYTVQKLTPEGRKNGSGSKWTINDGEEGFFDGVIVAIGSCDKPNRIFFEGSQDFQGKLVHSSQLDGLNWKGKRVVVIGGGASAVEALELAVKSQCTTPAVMITRTDKWFLPRGFLFSFFVSSIPYGRDCFPFRIFEKYLKTFHYQNHLKWMIPLEKDGKTQASLYGKTPIVNSNFLKLVRTGTANYVRAHVMKISGEGVEVRRFLSDKSDIIGADIIVEATGYHRPKVSFLESEGLFSGPKGSKQYSPPNVFLQAFLVPDWRCAMPNAAFVEGAASVGHFHIGILARLMMMFMMDSSTAPSPEEMSRWVNEKIKFKGSLIYWTYSEQLKWYLQFLLSSFRRSRWIVFVLFGWGRTGNRLYAPLR